MAQDRTALIAGLIVAGFAAGALGLVAALRTPPAAKRDAPPREAGAADRPVAPEKPAAVPAPPRTVAGPPAPDPLPAAPVAAPVAAPAGDDARVFESEFAAAALLVREGRFREAGLELDFLAERHPARAARLEELRVEAAHAAAAALASARALAEREPGPGITALRSLAARTSGEIAAAAEKDLEELVRRQHAADASEARARAEGLAAEGKFREAAEALEAAEPTLAGEEARAARDRAALLRRVARYAGAAPAATLASLDAALLTLLEDSVEAYLTTGSVDRRNAIHRSLQGIENLSLDLLAAVVLHGGTFEDVPAGDTVETYALPGGEKREVIVSVPRGYTPDRRWPVLIHLHGTNASLDLCRQWCPYYQDLSRGRFLVLQPVSARNSGWGPMKIGEQQAPAALRHARGRFPIDPDRVWIAGQSMGSHGTWHQAMRHGDLYAAFLPKSGTPYGAYGRNWKAYLDNLRLAPVWSIHGSKDPMFPIATPREFWAICDDRGLNVKHFEYDVGHEGAPETEIRKSFDWMVEQTRDVYPKSYSWTADHLDFMRCWWIEGTRFDDTIPRDRVQFSDQEKKPVETRMILQTPATFSVSVDGQEIRLKTTGLTKLRVLWSPHVVDLAKEVKIFVNGRQRWKGIPERSIRQMLEEARLTGRRDVVFYGSVEVDAK